MKPIFLNFSLLCSCTNSSELPDIPQENCPESLGQLQKVLFQRIYSAPGVKNKFVIASANPNAQASWTALTSASDDTKVTVSPKISQPETEFGAPREYGGGNATVGGIPIILGSEPTTFTGRFLHTKQNVIEALKEYQCEEIGVFLVDEFGKIAGITDDHTTPTEVYPIPIRQFFRN
jgi:uncharacterized membrane protein